MNTTVHSFTPQVFIEHLRCAKPRAGGWCGRIPAPISPPTCMVNQAGTTGTHSLGRLKRAQWQRLARGRLHWHAHPGLWLDPARLEGQVGELPPFPGKVLTWASAGRSAWKRWPQGGPERGHTPVGEGREGAPKGMDSPPVSLPESGSVR